MTLVKCIELYSKKHQFLRFSSFMQMIFQQITSDSCSPSKNASIDMSFQDFLRDRPFQQDPTDGQCDIREENFTSFVEKTRFNRTHRCSFSWAFIWYKIHWMFWLNSQRYLPRKRLYTTTVDTQGNHDFHISVGRLSIY